MYGARDAALSVSASRDDQDTLRAIELMDSAINHTPESAAYRIRQASLFEAFRLRAGTTVDDESLILGSLSLIRDGLEYNPLSLLLRIEEGEALMRLVRAGQTDRAEEAAQAFERSGHLFPSAREANRNVAVRLMELLMLERALPWIEKTIELSTNPAETQDGLFLKGVIVRDLGQPAEALVILQQALDAQPSGPLAPRLGAMIEELQ